MLCLLKIVSFITVITNGVNGLILSSPSTPQKLLSIPRRIEVTSSRRHHKVFAVSHKHSPISLQNSNNSNNVDTNNESDEVYKDWSDERKSNLFQFLLRDLQVEGVPLLSVDGATDVSTMQAALWTTVAELYEQYRNDAKSNKVCLILEEIPISAIRTVVDDFLLFKTQNNNNNYKALLPELQYITLSLVGKGIGPAIIIEVGEDKRDAATAELPPINEGGHIEDTFKVTAVMKMFIDRVMKGIEVCPHFTTVESVTNDDKIMFRTCSNTNDIFHILSSFWNCICEISADSTNNIPSIVLSIPNTSIDVARFSIMTEFINRNFRLYRGDSIYELLYFHPQYTRTMIQPTNQPVFGHLPPTSWIQAMIVAQQDLLDTPSSTDVLLLSCSDYQRRSPVMAICIKQISAMEGLVPNDEHGVTLDLNVDIGDGTPPTTVQVPKSGAQQYVQNLQRLSRVGVTTLQSQLDNEIQIVQS